MPKKRLAIFLLIVSLVVYSTPVSAATKTWSFDDSSKYDYQAAKTEITDGVAHLLAAGKRLPITIDHSDGSATTVNEYQVEVNLTSSHTSYWSNVYDTTDGTDTYFTDADGNIISFYRQSFDYSGETASFWVQVPTIEAGASDNTIYMYFGDSNVTDLSSIEATFSYNTPKIVGYLVSDKLASYDLNAISLLDGNTISIEGTSQALDELETYNFSAVILNQGSAIYAKKLMYADNTDSYTDAFSPISFATSEMYYDCYRDSPNNAFSIVSPFGTTDVRIYDAEVLQTTLTNVDESGTTQTVPIANYHGVKIEADLPILVQYYTSSSGYDSKVYYPPTSDPLYGVPSTVLFVGGDNSFTSDWVNSSGSTGSINSNGDGAHYKSNLTRQGSGDAYRVTGGSPIGASSTADGDGGEATVLLPYKELGTLYGSANTYQYISVAAPNPSTTVSLYDSNGALIESQTGGTRSDVNALYFNPSYGGGKWKLVADKPIYVYYEPTDNDEKNIWTYQQMRQFTYPTPTVSISNTAEDAYPTSYFPPLKPNVANSQAFASLAGFSATEVTPGSGSFRYIVSNDGGASSWFYYNSGWTSTDGDTYSQTNTAAEINSNLSTLPYGSGRFVFKTFFGSDGANNITLEAVAVTYYTSPEGGVTASNIIPSSVVTQSANGDGFTTINFKAKDVDATNVTLANFRYTVDGGSNWLTPTGGDSSAALSSGWNDNGGSGYTSATSFETASFHSFTFYTTSSAVSGLAGVDQDDVQIKFDVYNGTHYSENNTTSETFTVDNLDPATLTTIDLVTQPYAGSAYVSLEAAFTENHPSENLFYVAINDGSYGSATTGQSGTAEPVPCNTNVTALDGDDYISSVKCVHTDEYGNSTTNQNTSPDLNLKYVIPYTPRPPIVNEPTSSTVNVAINGFPGESSAVKYAIYVSPEAKYVQADGTLGTAAEYRTASSWGTKTVTGLSDPVEQYNFRVIAQNPSDPGGTTTSEASGWGNSANDPPNAGYDVVNLIPVSQISQSTDGQGIKTINFRIADAQEQNCSLEDLFISTDDGITWYSPIGGNNSTAISWESSYSSAADITSGETHSFTLDTQHADIARLSNAYQPLVKLMFWANDGYSPGEACSTETFVVDNLAPTTETTVDLTAQPEAGDTTVSAYGTFSEHNPNTNLFYVEVNDGSYSSATSGESGTATPTTQAIAIGATLDGNDVITKIKIVSTDTLGNQGVNENTSPDSAKAYVKPYTPPAPTVENPTATSLEVTVNEATDEASGLEYSIHATKESDAWYVQADGTLGTTEVWQTVNDWGTGGTISVTDLTVPIVSYYFRTRSRNTSDTQHQSSSNSDYSSAVHAVSETPTVTTKYPSADAVGISLEANVWATFSESMSESEVLSAFSLKLIRDNNGNSTSEAISGEASYDVSSKKITFTPTATLEYNHTYQASIAATATDLLGVALESAVSWSFTTLLSSAEANTIISSDGKAWVIAAGNTLPGNGYFNVKVNDFSQSEEDAMDEADTKAAAEGNPFHYPLDDSRTKIQAVVSGQDVSDDLEQNITVRLYYNDADSDGVVDNTDPQVREDNLLIYRLDTTTQRWVRLPTSVVNATDNYVYATVSRAGIFVLMSTPATDLSSAYAFPIPFKPPDGHTTITFTNLASLCTIRIYTINGELVKTIQETNGDGQATWDGKTDFGGDAFSGVYLYLITSDSDKKTGKLIIVR